MATQRGRARFGAFEFNFETGELLKHGTRVRLQEQPARILRVLVSHAGELVSREELQRELWPSGVFTDYEHGLHRSVNRLRTTLGDVASAPRFLQNEARRGYRFIAPVEFIPPEGVAAADVAEEGRNLAEPAATPAEPQPVASRWGERLVRIGALAAALMTLVVGVGISYGWRETRVAGFARRDFVLVSHFDNRTGDPTLDGTLDFTLARELSQSEYVNVASRQRVGDVLALMRRPPDTRLTAELAREVCLRDPAIRAFVAGRVDKVGSAYVLSVDLVDPASDTAVHSWTEQVSSPTQLLPSLHDISGSLRRELGEKLPAQNEQKPLQKVTTSSIDALKLYSDAAQLSEGSFNGDPNRIIGLLAKAVSEDPQFASAHTLLSEALFLAGRRAEAENHCNAALRLADSVTDRERWYIEASYYNFCRRDGKKAIVAYEELLRRYPDDVTALRRMLFLTGQAAFGYRAADLRPNNLAQQAWGWVLAEESGNAALAQRYSERSRALMKPETLEVGPGAVAVQFSRAIEDVNTNKLAAADDELRKIGASSTTLAPKTHNEVAYMLGNFYLYLGRLRDAERWFTSAEGRTAMRGMAGLAYARGVPRRVQQLKRVAQDPNVTALLVTLGDSSDVRRGLDDPTLEPVYRNILNGADAMARGDLPAAVAWLRRASAMAFYADQKLAAGALLAEALERSNDLAGAADALGAATSSRLLPLLNLPGWAIESKLHLARLYRKLGRQADAERIEDSLKVLLAGADSDFAPARELRQISAAKESTQRRASADQSGSAVRVVRR